MTELPSPDRHPVDVHVGERIRFRRRVLGVSQEQLAGVLGLTFQQIQKYEKGSNRVSASRLYEISEVLEIPIEYFFAGLPKNWRENPKYSVDDTIADRFGLAGAAAIRAISNAPQSVQQVLVRLCEAMNETSSES